MIELHGLAFLIRAIGTVCTEGASLLMPRRTRGARATGDCVHRVVMMSAAIACLYAFVPVHAAESYAPRREASSEDSKAILQLAAKFQEAIKTKNSKELSTLLLNDNILFTRSSDSKEKQRINETSDVNFDGIRYGSLSGFSQLLSTSKDDLEEKFYNLTVTQDGSVAWVMFDYQFLVDGKAKNHGVETWQLFKPDGNTWKIISVVWSSHDGE